MISAISGWLFTYVWRWKIVGDYPCHIPKKLIVVAPHTSNWDFPIGILFRVWKKHDIRFVGKKSLFRFPLGAIARWLGGLPVDRKKSGNFVNGVVDLYHTHPALAICITPEGTRNKVSKFKTGFYFIAKNANIPIVPIQFDWKNRHMVIGEPYTLTEDKKQDIAIIEDYFRGIIGKYPDKSFY